MHPLLSHCLHPAVRVAVTAWLVTRGALIVLALLHADIPPWEGTHTMIAHTESAGGALLMMLSSSLPAALSPIVSFVARELFGLAGIFGVYHFCRKDALPQTAERATWLFALSPMACLVEGLDASLAMAAGLVALGAIVHGRYMLCAGASVVGAFFFPHLALMAPALIGLGLRARTPHTPSALPWFAGLAPLIGLATLVPVSFLFAGAHGISMRGLSSIGPSLHDIQDVLAHGVPVTLDKALWLGGFFVCLAGAYRYAEQTPKSWPLLTLPIFFAPLLHVDTIYFAPLAMLAVPLFAYAAKLTDNPALERPLSALLLSSSLLCVM